MSEVDPNVERTITEIFSGLQRDREFRTLIAIHALTEIGEFNPYPDREVGSSHRSNHPLVEVVKAKLAILEDIGFVRRRTIGDDNGIPGLAYSSDSETLFSLDPKVATVAKRVICIPDKPEQDPYLTQVRVPNKMVDKYTPPNRGDIARA